MSFFRGIFIALLLAFLAAIAWAIIGTLLVAVASFWFGGTARAGFEENGQYFLAGKGVYTEVSPRVFHMLWWLELSALLCVLVLAAAALATLLRRVVDRYRKQPQW